MSVVSNSNHSFTPLERYSQQHAKFTPSQQPLNGVHGRSNQSSSSISSLADPPTNETPPSSACLTDGETSSADPDVFPEMKSNQRIEDSTVQKRTKKSLNTVNEVSASGRNQKPHSDKETAHYGKSLQDTGKIFAPLSTPMHRRLQTMMVFWHSISIPVCASLSLLAITCFPFVWMLLLPYLFYFITDKAFENGKVVQRYSLRFRSLPMWKYFVGYFPIVLHKTEDLAPSFEEKIIYDDFLVNAKIPHVLLKLLSYLAPSFFANGAHSHIRIWHRKPYKKLVPNGKKYLFGYHPHGVVAMGAMGALGTDGAGWSSMFPNIPISLLTLESQFIIPFYRDYLLALGISSVTKKNIEAILNKNCSVCIVIGGARESLLAKPKARKLVLKERKGFIKVALRNPGTKLVPVFAFGENELYEIMEPSKNSYLRKFQLAIKRLFGFTIPFFHARGIFNYDFGLLPYRRRIDVVVGRAIDIPDDIDPSDETITKYHEIYVKELLKLYNDNKDKYGYTEPLEIE